MERVASVGRLLQGACHGLRENKSDLNPESTLEIRRYTEEKGYTFLATIPFDPVFTKAMGAGPDDFFEYNTHTAAGKRCFISGSGCSRRCISGRFGKGGERTESKLRGHGTVFFNSGMLVIRACALFVIPRQNKALKPSGQRSPKGGTALA